ncbi:MAG: hypothetical protein IKD27_05770 [Oscillospiraceae bacterium]|nr:hypothetical protein [Oscillospiraceae bacterium]
MDNYLRQQVVEILTRWIDKNGGIPLAQVPIALAHSGLDRDLYRNLSLKRWLQTYFGSEFIIECRDGREIVLCTDSSGDENKEVTYGCDGTSKGH